MSEQEPNRYDYPPGGDASFPTPDDPPKKTQSKLGIASFVIGLVGLVVAVVAIIVTTSFIMDQIGNEGNYETFLSELENGNGDLGDLMPIVTAGLLMLLSSACCLVGLILGIVGACAKGKHKAFPVIGIVVNALLPVGFIALFMLGLAMGGTA
ncbi:hypothetical protein [Paenibacillus glycinis]|uniref:DUF4064 domain-containing protein n=1 Tax=Paenibacillus glycinis TaxID=2697035 RepID=A0ABW9XUA1_9BACL|nr:hypothetical protein [Paenibacillus glycinis]NBD26121.1 hypothetical protein [Paenibacillus glycinis]